MIELRRELTTILECLENNAYIKEALNLQSALNDLPEGDLKNKLSNFNKSLLTIAKSIEDISSKNTDLKVAQDFSQFYNDAIFNKKIENLNSEKIVNTQLAQEAIENLQSAYKSREDVYRITCLISIPLFAVGIGVPLLIGACLAYVIDKLITHIRITQHTNEPDKTFEKAKKSINNEVRAYSKNILNQGIFEAKKFLTDSRITQYKGAFFPAESSHPVAKQGAANDTNTGKEESSQYVHAAYKTPLEYSSNSRF